VAAARNVAIRRAHTDLVAFLDADDLYLPGHLAAVVPTFERDQRIVLCYADGELFDGRETIRRSLLYGTRVASLPYDQYEDGLRVFRESAYTSLLSGNYIPVTGTAFRRLQAEEVGLFDESLVVAEDREFFMRMSRKGRFAYVPHATHLKRRHGTNLTHVRNTARNMRHQFLALAKPLAAARELSLSPEEVAQTRHALRRHAWSLLYEASRRGIRAYAEAVRFVISYGVVGPSLTPRHVARALVYSVKDDEPSA
jgi:glycosyltransferase involved in cell wall biosynthesis